MQEYWLCEACRSMNRGDSRRCYRCRANRSTSTMAVVHERRLEGVLLPGADYLEQNEAQAMLAVHPYTAAWPLGYFAAVLLFLPVLFEVGAIAAYAAEIASIVVPAYAPGPGVGRLWIVCLAGYGFSLFVASVAQSIFLGLINRNVPSLGGGQPRFGPIRAGFWWIESLLWSWRAELAIWLPMVLAAGGIAGMWRVGFAGVFSLTFGLGLAWLSIKVLGSPLYALRKPARLPKDLITRLALQKTPAGQAGLWSGAWITSRLITVTFPLVVLGAFVLVTILASLEILSLAAGTESLDITTLANTYGLLMTLILVGELIADAIALALLARLTLSLCEAERGRRKWVLFAAATPGGVRPTPQPAPPPPPQPRPAPPSEPAPPVAPTPQPAAGSTASTVPNPAIPYPRWIRTQADSLAERQRGGAPVPEPVEEMPPGTPEPVLRPSINVVPVYSPPARSPRPASPAPAQAVEPAAAEAPRPGLSPIPEPDRPEGM
jgi:hypothetical protein